MKNHPDYGLPEDYRLHILAFEQAYGRKATIGRFKVSSRSLDRWKEHYYGIDG